MFNGRIFIEGNIVLNCLVEEGICTEDAECSLRDLTDFTRNLWHIGNMPSRRNAEEKKVL